MAFFWQSYAKNENNNVEFNSACEHCVEDDKLKLHTETQ